METRIIFFIVVVILLVLLIGISYNYYEKSECEEIIYYDEYGDYEIYESEQKLKEDEFKDLLEKRIDNLQDKIDVLNLENSKLFTEINLLKTNYVKILNTPPVCPVPCNPLPPPVCPVPCPCLPPVCPPKPNNFVRGGGFGTVTSTLTLNGKGNKCMINFENAGVETGLFNFTNYKNILSAEYKTIFMDESALLLKCVVGEGDYYMPLYKVFD